MVYEAVEATRVMGTACFIFGIYKYTGDWIDNVRHGRGNVSMLMDLFMMAMEK